MYSVRILTTSDASLPPPNFGPNLTWDRLSETLRREVGPDAAALLAEPVPDPGRGETHWHVEADQDPVPVSALPAKDREILLERLAELRARIRGYASRLEKAGGDENARLASGLRSAILVPDEASCVWSLGGNPLLAAWGRKSEAVERPSHVIYREAEPPRSSPDANIPSLPVAEAGTAQQSTVRAARGRASPFPLLLWLLFICLTVATAYLLLPACAIDVTLVRPFFNACPRAEANALPELRDQNRALRDAIEKAETRIALSRVPCPADRSSTKTETLPPRDERSASARPTEQETRQRAQDAGGKHGSLDITLSWNGHADLDLHVYCPGGALSYKSDEKRGCSGGEFEIDMNRGEVVDNPVEHASWAEKPPAGPYRVEVQFYDYRDAPQVPVPFTVVVTDGGVLRTYNGVLHAKGDKVTVVEFGR